MEAVARRFICVLTVIGDRFWSPLIAAVVSALLVLGLPGVIDLQAAVELLSAGGQQLDVCAPEHDTRRECMTTRKICLDTNLCSPPKASGSVTYYALMTDYFCF